MNKRNLIGYPTTAILAFLIGTGAGASTTVAAEPVAAQVVTKTVTVPGPTVTVTTPGKTITKAVTPQVCVDALDKADAAFAKAGEGFAAAGNAFDAVANLDVDAMESEVKTLTKVSTWLGDHTDAYKADEMACRATR